MEELTWSTEKQIVRGLYLWRLNSNLVHSIEVVVDPENDAVGPWPDGRMSQLNLETGEWAGTINPAER